MNKFVPVEKMSKKARRALYNARRGTWGAINPATRKPPNPKAYNRKKSRREVDIHDAGIFYCEAIKNWPWP